MTTAAAWSAQPLSSVDADALLGDLLLHEERFDAAASRLKLGLAQNPAHARATASLGRVLYLQGDSDQGLALMEKAAERATDYLPHARGRAGRTGAEDRTDPPPHD